MKPLIHNPSALTLLLVLFTGSLHSQAVLDRTPNISNGWIPEVVQFNFNHRMWTQEIGDDTRALASPLFLLGMPVTQRGMLAIRYGPNSDVVQAHEVELFGRWVFAREEEGIPLRVALDGGYNFAAESFDGGLFLKWPIWRISLLGTMRAFSSAFDTDDFRTAAGAGLIISITPTIALAGDVVSLLDRSSDESIAWSAGLQLRVPRSPHTFSVQVGNARTYTLQGGTRGNDTLLWGFEFTTPMSFLGSGLWN